MQISESQAPFLKHSREIIKLILKSSFPKVIEKFEVQRPQHRRPLLVNILKLSVRRAQLNDVLIDAKNIGECLSLIGHDFDEIVIVQIELVCSDAIFILQQMSLYKVRKGSHVVHSLVEHADWQS
jgi:hypothetical protein